MFTEEINRGINWVLRVQNSDGGWGGPFKEYTWSGAWTTAGVLYILAKAEKKEEVLNAIFRGLSWLGKYQNKDGGFPRVQYDLSSVDATSFSIICFKALEESEGFIKTNITTTIHLMLKEAKNYLLKAQNSDGSWGYCSGQDKEGRVIPTAFAIIALSKINENSLREIINRGVDWLKKNRNSDGGWGYTKHHKSNPMATATALLALVSSGESRSSKYVREAIKWLKNNTLKNGGWQPLQELHILKGFISPSPKGEFTLSVRDIFWRWFTTPFCIWALVSAGESPMEAYIYDTTQYLLSLQHNNGGWAVDKGEEPIVWATYQAIICLYEIENNIDLKRDYQAIKGLIQDLKNYIKNLGGDPSLPLEHKKLLEHCDKSPPIYIGDKGLYMSKRVFLLVFVGIITLLCAFSSAIYYYPSLMFSLHRLAIIHFKTFVGFWVGTIGSLIIFILHKIYEISRKEIILALLALWFSLTLYIM